MDEAIGDEEAVGRLLAAQSDTELADTSRVVRLRARTTKLDMPARRHVPEQVANELAECARRFEFFHRRNIYEASKLFDSFICGKLDDTQPEACHNFAQQLSLVRRNRLNLASVESQMNNKDADIPPGRRIGCDTPLSAQHLELLEEAFAAAAASKASSAELDEEARKKKARRSRLLDETEEELTGKDALLNRFRFAQLCRFLGRELRAKEVTTDREIARLFKVATASAPKASLAACIRTFATVTQDLPLIQLEITNATSHFVEVSWTWNGLPELHKRNGRWEAKVESSLIFVLEMAKLSPAYGVRDWQQAAAPTRRLEARAHLSGQTEWEEYAVVGMGDSQALGSAGGAMKVRGPSEQFAFRVLAKTRGGTTPPSNIVMFRPKRSCMPLTLDLPGPLPPYCRGILDIEDLFRKEERATGLATIQQFEPLLAALGRRTFELSQLFRLFAVAGAAQPDAVYSLTPAQFRGFVVALGLAPQIVNFRVIDGIFKRVQRLTQSKIEGEGSPSPTSRSSLSRAPTRSLSASSPGPKEVQPEVMGFTQFVSAMLRVANAAWRMRSIRAAGVHAQFDSMMEQDVLPLHQKIATPTEFDRFLRSRPAVCVFQEHKVRLMGIFEHYADIEGSSRHAFMHARTMNVAEWLKAVADGGYFEEAAAAVAADAEDDGGERAVLTPLRAMRIFAEVNLDDVQLDIVQVDLVHLPKVDPTTDEKDLYAEVVFGEFCMCVGYLMLFSAPVMRAAVEDKKRIAAELLDMFLREDFLPRYSSTSRPSPALGGMGSADEALGGMGSAGESAQQGRPEEQAVSEGGLENATVDMNTDYEWIEAAFRGGRERFVVREFLRKRAYGKALVRLANEVVPVR